MNFYSASFVPIARRDKRLRMGKAFPPPFRSFPPHLHLPLPLPLHLHLPLPNPTKVPSPLRPTSESSHQPS